MLVRKALQAVKVLQVRKAAKDLKGSKAFKVQRVARDRKGSKGSKVLQDRKVLRVVQPR